MIDSNRTLTFNRTARDAYGHSIEFDDGHAEKAVGYGATFVAGFMLCLVIFKLLPGDTSATHQSSLPTEASSSYCGDLGSVQTARDAIARRDGSH